MKIRFNFVSNSSSSSFVIAKCYMTEEQIKEFSEWLDSVDDLYETYIGELPLYFIGTKSNHEARIEGFLQKIGVDMQYVGICE